MDAVLIVLCAGALLACDSQAAPGKAGAPGAPSEAPGAALEKAVEKAVDDAVGKAGTAHLFDPEDKALRARACEFLTAEMVAGLFAVPAADLHQTKLMGCMYTWRKDGELLDAKLMMIRVHRTPEAAANWFGSATATTTKAQLDATMDQAKQKVQEHEAVDTKLKKKTAANLTDIAKLGMPDEGISYDDVPGLGDQARISNADGALWLRVANMTFQVYAFKGPDQPKPKFDPKNIKGIAKAVMEAQKAWMAATLDQRKRDAMKLAPVVLEALSAALASPPAPH